MRLSDGVEWGVHACTLLAVLPPDRALPAAKLAEYHGVPAAYLAKHLQALARAGVLETVKGPRGGYRLARPADGDHAARRRRGDRRRRARVSLQRDPPARPVRGAGARVHEPVRHQPGVPRGRRGVASRAGARRRSHRWSCSAPRGRAARRGAEGRALARARRCPRRNSRRDCYLPARGFLPWLALLRRARSLRFFVFLLMRATLRRVR